MSMRGMGIRFVAALVAGVALAAPTTAAGAADRTVTVGPDAPATWRGPAKAAQNQEDDGEPCGKDPENYCDHTLVNVGSPSTQATLTVEIDDYSTPIDDFDLVVYRSDAAGNRGER